MSEHALIKCPACEHELKVRREYAGKKIACKYCNHAFRFQPDPPPDNPSDTAIIPIPPAPTSAEVTALTRERDSLLAELAQRQTQDAAAVEAAQRMATLQDDNDSLRNSLEMAERERLAIRDRAEALAEQLAGRQEQAGRMEEEREKLLASVAALQADLNGARTEVDRLQTEATDTDLEVVSEREETLLALADERDRLKQELGEGATRIAEAAARASQVEIDLAASRSEHASVVEQLSRSGAEATKLQTELTAMSREVNDVRDQLAAVEADAAAAKSAVAAAHKESESLRGELTAAGRGNEELKAHAANLSVECVRLTQELGEERERLAAAGEQSAAELAVLRERIESLNEREQALGELQKQFEDAQATWAAERDDLSTEHERNLAAGKQWHDQVQQSALALAEAAEREKRLAADATQLTEELQAARAGFAEATSQRESAQALAGAEAHSLRQELAIAQEHHDAIVAAKAQLQEQRDAARDEALSLRSRLDQAQAALDAAEASRGEVDAEVAASHSQLSVANAEAAALRDQLAAAEAARTDLQSALAALQAETSTLRQDLAQARAASGLDELPRVADVSDLRHDLEALQQREAEHQQQLAAERENFERAASAFRREIADLRGTLRSMGIYID